MASPRKEAVPASTTASRRLVRRRARASVRRFAALRRTWCPRCARGGPGLLHPARWCRPSGRGGAAPPFCPPSPPRPRPWHSPPPAPGRRRAEQQEEVRGVLAVVPPVQQLLPHIPCSYLGGATVSRLKD